METTIASMAPMSGTPRILPVTRSRSLIVPKMNDILPCVITTGGPLIALPRELLSSWRDALPADGGAVLGCDYDRACDEPSDAVTIGDSFGTWAVDVGDGLGLAD